jgi:hypothetical protein
MTTSTIAGYVVGIPQTGTTSPILSIATNLPLNLPAGNAITEVQIKMLNDLGGVKNGNVEVGTLISPENITVVGFQFMFVSNAFIVPSTYTAFNIAYPILITNTSILPYPEKFSIAIKYKPLSI